MSGTYQVKVGDTVIGAVARFAGEKRGEQWVAWAPRINPNEERRAKFRTRHAAVKWLRDIHEREAKP